MGSTTFRRADIVRGFDPDACFYIAKADHIRRREDGDPATDPPPELVIEIDTSSPSLNKLPIYAAVGVPEVWRYDGRQVSLLKLTDGEYEASDTHGLPQLFSLNLLRRARP